nr:hypothetical protein M8J77_013592 [Diaphorina citri]
MNINKNEFLFLPLGGVGRIGMNVSLYHYQGKWIMIDLGIGFADETMPALKQVVHFILGTGNLIQNLLLD